MLTDERQTQKMIDQNSSEVKPQYMVVSLYINPEAHTVSKQVCCNAAPNAVPMRDAMIASSGTGTVGPLMGTTHSPQSKGEMKDNMNKSMQNNRSKIEIQDL